MEPKMRYAVVTGGTGSLGQSIAAAIQGPGWMVAAPGSAELDVRNKDLVRKYFSGRPVDLLVCSAGIIRDAPLARLTEHAWDETWAINFQGALTCVKNALPVMLASKSGHIILISSFSAIHPPIGQAAYATAKAALLGLVADLAARHGPSNIRVNAILPGYLETRMTETVSDRRRAEVLASHCLGRFNTCEHVARFIQYLHHHLPHNSGQVFCLDSRVTFP